MGSLEAQHRPPHRPLRDIGASIVYLKVEDMDMRCFAGNQVVLCGLNASMQGRMRCLESEVATGDLVR